MHMLMAAAALAVLIVTVGVTGATWGEARRDFTRIESDGSHVSRWNAGIFSFAVYRRWANSREEVVGKVSGFFFGEKLMQVG